MRGTREFFPFILKNASKTHDDENIIRKQCHKNDMIVRFSFKQPKELFPLQTLCLLDILRRIYNQERFLLRN
jgi:hypothetical protein